VGVTLGVGDAVVIGFGAEKTIKHDFFYRINILKNFHCKILLL